jgi:hypothetical protein
MVAVTVRFRILYIFLVMEIGSRRILQFAAELLGDAEKEQSYYRQLASNCDAAIEPRPELLHARQILQGTK